jgi:phosphoribosyl-AMP cyclohydrolase
MENSRKFAQSAIFDAIADRIGRVGRRGRRGRSTRPQVPSGENAVATSGNTGYVERSVHRRSLCRKGRNMSQPPAAVPDFSKGNGLVPAIAQDADSGEVLMLGYMNAESYAETLAQGLAVYFSRSRNGLWHKGAESGHVQEVRAIFVDCDGDTILLKVHQHGGAACHQGYRSCFFRQVTPEGLAIVARPVFDPTTVYGREGASTLTRVYVDFRSFQGRCTLGQLWTSLPSKAASMPLLFMRANAYRQSFSSPSCAASMSTQSSGSVTSTSANRPPSTTPAGSLA